MEQKKRKPPYFLYAAVYIILLYFGLQIASCAAPGDTIIDIIKKYEAAISKSMLYVGWSKEYSLKTIVLITIICGVYVLYDMTAKRNFLPGREYGNAKWADINAVNKQFTDKDRYNNRIYSERLRISMDGYKTRINNNALILGGSGAGKSMFLIIPNILMARAQGQYPGSFILTDPKGELLQKCGLYLKRAGYRIKVLNLTTEGMSESDCYNPFDYIRRESDIDKLITNLIANTTDKNATKQDGFWEKAESMLLQALFLFVWMDGDKFDLPKNMNSVINLLSLAEIPSEADRQKKKKSPLDEKFDELVEKTKNRKKGGTKHPAFIKYKKCMGGAVDTVRSIVISANARMAIFENEEVERLLSTDEMDLASIGTGLVGNQRNVKTALFCVIPDADTTYNCIAGMLYTQLFQELYQVADAPDNKGKLPVPVTFWLDEFANIALPDNFTRLLATMRSRLISSVIVLQNLAQIKKLYEKDWEVITGNCDVLVYLGGNEQSTHKYISENLGKTTIWKRSRGKSYGKSGSSSKNEDVLGRELLTTNEVRELDNDKCIVFVRGQQPIIDDKYRTLETKEFHVAEQLGIYVHSVEKGKNESVTIIDRETFEHLRKSGKLTAELRFTKDQLAGSLYGKNLTDEELLEKVRSSGERTDTPPPKDKDILEIDITELSVEQVLYIPEFELDEEQMDEVIAGIENGLSDEQIKSYILYDSASDMRVKRRMLEAINERKKKEGSVLF